MAAILTSKHRLPLSGKMTLCLTKPWVSAIKSLGKIQEALPHSGSTDEDIMGCCTLTGYVLYGKECDGAQMWYVP